MKYGYYADCNNQSDRDRRIEALRRAGAVSYIPSSRLSSRIEDITTGDIVLVTAMSDFAGEHEQLATLVRHLRRVGAHLATIDGAVDTTRLNLFSVLDSIAAVCALHGHGLSEKIASAMKVRKRSARRIGRRSMLQPHQIEFARQELEAKRSTISAMASALGVPYNILWRALRRQTTTEPTVESPRD